MNPHLHRDPSCCSQVLNPLRHSGNSSSSDFSKSLWFLCGECLAGQGVTRGPGERSCCGIMDQGGGGGTGGRQMERSWCMSKPAFWTPNTGVPWPFPPSTLLVCGPPPCTGALWGRRSGLATSELWKQVGWPAFWSLPGSALPGVQPWALLQSPRPQTQAAQLPGCMSFHSNLSVSSHTSVTPASGVYDSQGVHSAAHFPAQAGSGHSCRPRRRETQVSPETPGPGNNEAPCRPVMTVP